jgi:hypothetical protein
MLLGGVGNFMLQGLAGLFQSARSLLSKIFWRYFHQELLSQDLAYKNRFAICRFSQLEFEKKGG